VPSIDNRVVSMTFDNSEFERKIKTTIDSLDKLKMSLNFGDTSKSIQDISTSLKNFNLDSLSTAADNVSSKFSAMGAAAFAAVSNITNRAVDAGIALTKSLTITPTLTGYKEYETNISSIQTILANTSSKGSTLEDVNNALDELNTYSDQTIYNFSQMAKNIGTFSAAGVDLDTSVKSIKGIANIAAISGSNSEQASNAMYQLSQALASGSLKLMDWNSVVNAGMGGEVFQTALFETGKALNKLEGVGLDTTFEEWKNAGNSFRGSLETGWLTADVLTNTLQAFTGDLTEAQLTAMGYTKEQAKEMLRLGALGKESATSVKTLTQLLGTVKESVASGWSASFRTIFGDFEQAKKLFTMLNQAIGTVVSTTADARNKILGDWAALGGRTDIIDGIIHLFAALGHIKNSVKDAFREVFPRKTGEDLARLSKSFLLFMQYLEPSPKTLDTVKRVFKGVFAALEIGFTIVKAVARVFQRLFQSFNSVAGSGITGVVLKVADAFVALNEKLVSGQGIERFVQTVFGLISKVTGYVGLFVELFKTGFSKAANGLAQAAGKMGAIFFSVGEGLSKLFDVIKTGASKLGSGVVWVFKQIGSLIGSVVERFDPKIFTTIGRGILTFFKAIGSIASTVGSAFVFVLGGIANGILSLGTAIVKFAGSGINKLTGFFSEASVSLEKFDNNFKKISGGGGKGRFVQFKTALDDTGKSVTEFRNKLSSGSNGVASEIDAVGTSVNRSSFGLLAYKDIFEKVFNVLKPIGDKIADLFSKLSLNDILKIAGTVSIVKLLKGIRTAFEDFGGVFRSFSSIFGQVSGVIFKAGEVFTGIKDVLAAFALEVKAQALQKIAIAVAILAVSLIALAMVDHKALGIALSVAAGGFSLLVGSLAVLAKLTGGGDAKTGPANLLALTAALSLIAVAVLLMTASLKLLANEDPERLTYAAAALLPITTAFIAILESFKKFENIDFKSVAKGALGILAIGGAVKSISKSVERLAKLDPKALGFGLAGVTTILGGLVIAMKNMPQDTDKVKGMIGISIALYIISKAIGLLGDMKPEELAAGLGAMAALMTMLTGVLVSLDKVDTAGVGVALLGFAVAIGAVTAALVIISMLSLESLAKGIGALAVVLYSLALALVVMNGSVTGALALGVAALGLTLLAIAMDKFSEVGWGEIVKGLLGIAAVIAIIAVAGALVAPILVPMLGLAAVLLLVGAGFALIGIGAKGIAEAFSIVSKAGDKGIAVFKELLKAIGGAIPTFIAGFALGIVELVETVLKLAPTLVKGLISVIIQALKGMREVLPELILTVADLIDALVTLILDKKEDMISAGFALLISFLSGLKDNIREITTLVVDLIEEFLTVLAKEAGRLTSMGLLVLTEFLKGITDNIQQVIDAGADLVVKIMEGLTNNVSEVTESIGTFLTTFITEFGKQVLRVGSSGLAVLTAILDAMINGTVIIGRKIGEFLVALGDAIVDNINLAKEQGVRIAKTILNALATAVPELADAVGLFAINLLNGLADVIRNRGKGIRDAALNLGDAILDAVSFGMFDKMKAGGNFLLSPFKKMGGYATDAWKWAFDSNSPSKLFIKLAGEIPAGIVAGLNKDKTAVSSVTGLSERIVNAASKSFGAIPAFDAIGDINPVISPVLDLTNVQQGARNINGMFSESQIGASVSLNQARALSIATLGNNSTSTENSAPVVKEVKFEQIINSPTTLSNAEIYRQTRSQIQMAKEELFK
jgi:tape measure domain-containing protein